MSPRRPKLPGSAVDRLSATYQYLLGRKQDLAQPDVKSALNREVRDALISKELRQEMIGVLRHLSLLGLCGGRISEASLQLQNNIYLVTRENGWFQDLAEEDLLLVLPAAAEMGEADPTPPHWDWHLEIYRNRPGTQAVILGQPPAVMALARAGRLPEREHLPAAAESSGEYRFCQPESSAIAESAEGSELLIIPGIGVLSAGVSIREAAINLELIGKLGEITLLYPGS
jgi:ribulose-5-phosphate 4-epimerase/fuculose-1-phosphate aldolase